MSNLVAIIDDSPTVRKIIETCLKRENYQVIAFNDGIEALRWYVENKQAPIPALVFLDIEMPKMDGYQVARYLKARATFANTTIIMISRRNGVIDRLKARLSGVDAYLTKPMPTQAILAIVQEHLGVLVPSIT